MKKTLICAGAIALSAGSVNAATFGFQQFQLFDQDSISYDVDGIGLTITAGTFGANTNPSTIDFSTRRVDRDLNDGIGADGGLLEADEVDGFFGNDVLVFSFDTRVRINSVSFAPQDIESNDQFAFGSVSGSTFTRVADFTDVSTPFDMSFFGSDAIGEAFGIGAIGSDDNFSITAMDVAAVPLPAAGWLLIAGLGGIAAMSRRKTSGA